MNRLAMQFYPAGIFYPLAQQCPSPHFNERPLGEKVSLLVIHNISLPAGYFGGDYISQLFQGTLNVTEHSDFTDLEKLKVSAHACIKRNGDVIQYVDFNKRAWHAGVSVWQGRSGCNDFSIGVELEGTDNLAYTTAQYTSLKKLTLFLQNRFPEISLGRIVGHNDIAFGRKTDPGQVFDWSRFRQSIHTYKDE